MAFELVSVERCRSTKPFEWFLHFARSKRSESLNSDIKRKATDLLAVALLCFVLCSYPVRADKVMVLPGDLGSIVQQVPVQYARAQTQEGSNRVESLLAVKALLDKIVTDFPASDEALSLTLGDKVGGVDQASLDEEILVAKAASAMPSEDATPYVSAEIQSPDPLVGTLSSCLRDPSLPSAPDDRQTKIKIRIEFDSKGRIIGMPNLLDPSVPDASARKLFQRTLFALDRCAGIKQIQLPGVAEMTVSATGVDEATMRGSTVSQEPLAVEAPLETTSPQTAAEALGNTAPEVVWAEADKTSEASLGLKRPDIAELQARLVALGFDTKGIDGVAGRGYRSAIKMWQVSQSIPGSGYLDDKELARLKEDSQGPFTSWKASEANAAVLEQASRPPRKARPTKVNGWYRNNEGMYCKDGGFGHWCQAWKPMGWR